MNLSPISFVAARLAQTTSAPVSSEVSPKQVVAPKGSSLAIRLPPVGQEPRPEVVSLSPDFVETKSSSMEQDSRCFSLAHWTNSRALRQALGMVVMLPLPSIAKPATGLPVFSMPSTVRPVQARSSAFTTPAGTVGVGPPALWGRAAGYEAFPKL